MGFYQQIAELWNNKDEHRALWKDRLIQWRRQPVIVELERPTRLDRARGLGYKAKKGFFLVRIRVDSGGRQREKFKSGRRSKKYGRRKIVNKNYQWVAEERAQRKFTNLEVLNSYEVAFDGLHYWFEVIMVDTQRPEIKADPVMKWITEKQHRKRVFRGKTSAGRSSRGLKWKGKGAEKMR